MKAILEYNLLEERDEYTLAIQGSTMYACLFSTMNMFRNHLKYNNKEWTDEELAVIENLRDEFFEILESNDFDLDCVS